MTLTDIQHDAKGRTSAHLPEVFLISSRTLYTLQIHAKVRSEEGEGKKDDGNGGEDEDGLVLRVSHDGELVLLDGSELEQLFRGCQKERFLIHTGLKGEEGERGGGFLQCSKTPASRQ
jgi:hypothetical protein